MTLWPEPLRSEAPFADGRRRSVVLVLAGLTAVNLLIGVVAGGQHRSLAIVIAALPLLLTAALWLAIRHRDWLIVAAFAIALFGGPLGGALPGVGGARIFPADLLVGIAFVGWALVHFLGGREDAAPWPRTVTLGWPLALLALTLAVAVVRGHAAWGTSYVSEPVRLFLYAGIAGAITRVDPARLYRLILAVFYVGTVVQTLQGLYHLATGTSQTTTDVLSTGGTRYLALSSAMFVAGALVLALLNLELDREHAHIRRDLAIVALATFDIVISLGRTTFVALAVVLPILAIALRHARRSFWRLVPLLTPVVVLLAVSVVVAQPSLPKTVGQRFTGHLSNDAAVIDRQRKFNAVLSGMDRHLLFGFGFGRPVQWESTVNTVSIVNGDPENSYIWVLAGGGVAALGALLALIVAFYVDGIRRLRRTTGEERALLVFALSMAFVLLINALTGPIMSTADFMLTIWICFVLPALCGTGRAYGARQ